MVPLGQQGTTLDAQLSRQSTQAAPEPHHSMQCQARLASAGRHTCFASPTSSYVMAGILDYNSRVSAYLIAAPAAISDVHIYRAQAGNIALSLHCRAMS